jgi:hypothetical protein
MMEMEMDGDVVVVGTALCLSLRLFVSPRPLSSLALEP